MFKYSMILFVLLMVISCVSTSYIPTEVSSEIPDNANVIQIYSSDSPTDFYRTIYRSLASQGFSFSQENEDLGTFSTEFKDIGQGTVLKIYAYIEESGNGSIAKLRGSWGVTASMGAGITAATGSSLAGTSAEEANWGKSGRYKISFGEMAVIANKIDHDRIEYLSE